MKITKSELRRFIKEELVNQGKLSEGEARRYNFMVTHKESKATSQVNAENGNEAIMLARGGELKKHGGPEGDYKVEKITESRLRKMIREELEVVLTNEEASDFFDIDPKEFLAEFVEEAMGAGSRKSRLYPDATKEERRAERRRNRRAGQRDAVEEPPDTDIPEPDGTEEYDINALVADYDPYSEEARELPSDVRKKIQDLRRKFSVTEPAS